MVVVSSPFMPRSSMNRDDAVIGLGPHNHYVSNRGVRDPRLGAGNPITILMFARPRRHSARIRSVIGLGQTKAAKFSARAMAGK